MPAKWKKIMWYTVIIFFVVRCILELYAPLVPFETGGIRVFFEAPLFFLIVIPIMQLLDLVVIMPIAWLLDKVFLLDFIRNPVFDQLLSRSLRNSRSCCKA